MTLVALKAGRQRRSPHRALSVMAHRTGQDTGGSEFEQFLRDAKRNPLVKEMIAKQFCLDADCLAAYGRTAGRIAGAAACSAIGLGGAAPLCAYIGGFLGKILVGKVVEVLMQFRPASELSAMQWAMHNFEIISRPQLEEGPVRVMAARAYLAERDEALFRIGVAAKYDFEWANRRLTEIGALGVQDVPEWQIENFGGPNPEKDRQTRWSDFVADRERMLRLSQQAGGMALYDYKYNQRRRYFEAIAEDANQDWNDRRVAGALAAYVEPFYKKFVKEMGVSGLSYEGCWLMWEYPEGPPSPPDVAFDLGLIGGFANTIDFSRIAQYALRSNLDALITEAQAHLGPGGYVDLGGQLDDVPRFRLVPIPALNFVSLGPQGALNLETPKKKASSGLATAAVAGGIGLGALLLLV